MIILSRFKRPRRVVITCMGCVTPIGIGRDAYWSALCKGESGVRRIEAFDVSDAWNPIQRGKNESVMKDCHRVVGLSELLDAG